jgi:hypothetical protein
MISTGSSANKFRWAWGLTNNETGANAGSDLILQALNDSGSYITSAITIKRSTGFVGIGVTDPGYALDVGTVARFRSNIFCNRVSCSAIQPQVLTTTFGLGATSGCVFAPEIDMLSQLGEAFRYWAYGYIYEIKCNRMVPDRDAPTSQIGSGGEYYAYAYITNIWTRLLQPQLGGNIQFSGILEPLVGTEDIGLPAKRVANVHVSNARATNYYNDNGTSILGQWNDVAFDVGVGNGISVSFASAGGTVTQAGSHVRWMWLGSQTIMLEGYINITSSSFWTTGLYLTPVGTFSWAVPDTFAGNVFLGNGTAAMFVTGTTIAASSNLIGVGAKTFNVQTNVPFRVGEIVTAYYTYVPTNYMVGQITAYNAVTGVLQMTATAFAGAGNWPSWTVTSYEGDDFIKVSTNTGGGGRIAALTKDSSSLNARLFIRDYIQFSITYKVNGSVP